MLHSLDYALNIEKKKSQNIISFRGVFAPTVHIYKPLIEDVAQRATITHLSPMCQGQISFQKTYK